jgi:hemolysin activation/secretion protein
MDHTLLLRLSGAGGWSLTAPFQLTLGGRHAVRGFGDEEFPGSRRLLVSVEDRLYLPWPAPELFDFGLSLFVDLGHMHAGEVPFGMNSGWRAALGGGIRFGLPPGTTTMTRIDLALPLGRKVSPKDLILRVSLRELLGILPGFRDEQMLRSLRSGMRPDIVSPPW